MNRYFRYRSGQHRGYHYRYKHAKLLRWTALGCAVLLTGLRVWTLLRGFDADGLLPRGSLLLPLTVLCCAAAFGAMLFLSLRLSRLPGTEETFTTRKSWAPTKLAGAELVLLGAALALIDGRHSLRTEELAVALAGIVSSVFMVWTALQYERAASFVWVRMVPALFAGASLVIRFQGWTQEPEVIHIVPELLAWTCCMVEAMLLAGFSLNVGHRRSSVLFGLAGGVFTCMALPDCFLSQRMSFPELLSLAGLALWCATYGLELTRKRVQREHHKSAHSSGGSEAASQLAAALEQKRPEAPEKKLEHVKLDVSGLMKSSER